MMKDVNDLRKNHIAQKSCDFCQLFPYIEIFELLYNISQPRFQAFS